LRPAIACFGRFAKTAKAGVDGVSGWGGWLFVTLYIVKGDNIRGGFPGSAAESENVIRPARLSLQFSIDHIRGTDGRAFFFRCAIETPVGARAARGLFGCVVASLHAHRSGSTFLRCRGREHRRRGLPFVQHTGAVVPLSRRWQAPRLARRRLHAPLRLWLQDAVMLPRW